MKGETLLVICKIVWTLPWRKIISIYFQRNDENQEKRTLLTLLCTQSERNMKLRLPGLKKQSTIGIEHWSMFLSCRKGVILFFTEARISKVLSITISGHRCKSSSVREQLQTLNTPGNIDRRDNSAAQMWGSERVRCETLRIAIRSIATIYTTTLAKRSKQNFFTPK